MNSKLKCSGCKSYFAASDMFRQARMQSYCSEECFWGRNSSRTSRKPPKNRPTTIRKPKASDIPDELRKKVKGRDGSCRFCGANYGLHLHHVVYRSQGGKHEESNLILLCNEHHALVHSNKKRWFPVLMAYIWTFYQDGSRLPVPMLEKRLIRQGVLPLSV